MLLLLLIVGCNKNKSKDQEARDLSRLVQTTITAEEDPKEELFKRLEGAMETATVVPDSIKTAYYYLKGEAFAKAGILDSSLVYYQKTINGISDGPLSDRQVTYFYNTWNAYFDKEEYGECIAINQRYKNLLSKNNNDLLTSIAHSLDKAIYLKTKEYSNALKSSSEQIKYLKRTDDTNAIVSAIISRTKILDDVHKDRKEVFRVLDSLTDNSDTYTNGINRMLYGQYGVHLFMENDYAKASTYFQKGIEFAKNIEHLPTRTKRLSNLYNNLAEASLELQTYDKAAAYLDTLSSLNIETLETRQQRAYLRNLFRLTSETGQGTKKTLAMLDSLSTFQNRTYQEKYSKDLAALKVANEKEKQLQITKREGEFKNFRLRLFLLIGGILAILLAILGWLFYRNKKNSLEKENLLTQQRLLRAQMNPHFTFNTLTVIQRMIDVNPKEAKNYLLKFSRLLASIFENSTFNYVLLSKELDALKQYMDLQRMRFEHGFDYHIDLNDIEDDMLYVPSMLLQPIVENSINHGFANIDYKGSIKIILEEKGDFINCRIEDNGCGILKNKQPSTRQSSTKLIKKFLEKVTRTPFTVENKKDIFEEQTGVIVTFNIPSKETIDD